MHLASGENLYMSDPVNATATNPKTYKVLGIYLTIVIKTINS